MRRFLLAAAPLSLALAAAATADDAILVLDASGSMWGEIEGRHKILIARDVIGDLLDDLPEDRRLGLVAYGHNRRGDCSDIETVAAIGADREAIRDAVNGLRPLGMTPLSDAVRHAAETLAYTEAPATVILVSDGEETCDADPCAVGRELEAAGVDFTAHVIGFDIATDEERRQLQCLADETGGRFIVASNADELSDALSQTVIEAEPNLTPVAPAPATARIRATDLADGPVVETGLAWTVMIDSGAQLYVTEAEAGDGALELTLEPGVYQVEVSRGSDGARASGVMRLSSGETETFTLALEIPLEASVTPPATVSAGAEIEIAWAGPERENDFIAIARPDQGDSIYLVAARVEDGQPAVLRAPATPGVYEARYVLRRPVRTLAATEFEVTAVETSVEGPAEVAAGASFEAAWTGPAYPGDGVVIARPDQAGAIYYNRAPAENGSPARLVAPGEAGDYELRYIMGRERVIAARTPIVVAENAITLEAPASAPAGGEVLVAWTGPANPGDGVVIARPDQSGAVYINRAAAEDGSPARLLMPGEPGDYEIRYVLSSQREIAAARPIEATAAEITLDAPDSVEAGAPIVIAWTGPANSGDGVVIARPDQSGAIYVVRSGTDAGAPARLVAPGEPGAYEIRYVLRAQRVVAVTRPLVVTAPDINFVAPSAVPAGGRFTFEWSGPANAGDYFTIARPDQSGALYVERALPDGGSPATIRAPGAPGEYELRYILQAQRTVAHAVPLTVEPVAVTLDAPASAPAGSTITVAWTGPDNPGDAVTLARPDQSAALYVGRARARADAGAPAELVAPEEPGTYELRYVLDAQNTIALRRTIEITPAE